MKKTITDTKIETFSKWKSEHGENVIAIVPAYSWFNGFQITPSWLQPSDFVVCSWKEWSTGEKVWVRVSIDQEAPIDKFSIDAKQTIAICKNRTDADVIFALNVSLFQARERANIEEYDTKMR